MKLCQIVLIGLSLVASCFAQSEKAAPQEEHFYRLDYVVKEVDGGKVVNSRNYSTMITTGRVAEVRTGNKVPYSSDKGVAYQDVGMNIDARRPREVENQLALEISADLSSVAPVKLAQVTCHCYARIDGNPTFFSRCEDPSWSSPPMIQVRRTRCNWRLRRHRSSS